MILRENANSNPLSSHMHDSRKGCVIRAFQSKGMFKPKYSCVFGAVCVFEHPKPITGKENVLKNQYRDQHGFRRSK